MSCTHRVLGGAARLRVAAAALLVASLYAGLVRFGAGSPPAVAVTDASPWDATWVTNGPVYSIVPAGDVAYIGGEFTLVGPCTGHGVPVSTSTASPINPYPKVDGSVYAAVPDLSGGWYIAGSFARVGGEARERLAHILPGGGLLPFDPGADGTVQTLALSPDGSTLYLGGNFTHVGGEGRERIAALDTSSGALKPFNPGADDMVYSLSTRGDTVYAGGQFTSIGGESRQGLAVFLGDYVVSASVAGGHGTLDPATQRVYHGKDTLIDISPDPGYRIASIVDNGIPATIGDPYVIQGVTQDHEVEVSFAPSGQTWYLAEGCTQGDFETWVLVQNPNPEEVRVDFDFMTSSGEREGPHAFPLPGLSRCSLRLNDFVTDWHVSTRVSATGEVVCERAMYGAGRAWAQGSVGYSP